MTVTLDKIGKVQHALCWQIHQALGYFYCAQALHRAFGQHPLMTYSFFFAYVYSACVGEAVLALARITKKQEDSITIHHFINLVENNPRLLHQHDLGAVQQSVNTHREVLTKYKPLIESVCDQRDVILAHLDKQHINDPSKLLEHLQAVNLPKLGNCLQELLTILKDWGEEYLDYGFLPIDLQTAIDADMDVLLTSLTAHGAHDRWIKLPQLGEN